jgi:hypothetical protein
VSVGGSEDVHATALELAVTLSTCETLPEIRKALASAEFLPALGAERIHLQKAAESAPGEFTIKPNQGSTRLSPEELVGVKCTWKRGWAASHSLTLGCLWAP